MCGSDGSTASKIKITRCSSQLDCLSGGTENPAFGLRNIALLVGRGLTGLMCGMCVAHMNALGGNGLDTEDI